MLGFLTPPSFDGLLERDPAFDVSGGGLPLFVAALDGLSELVDLDPALLPFC